MSQEQWIWQCDELIPSQTGAGRPILETLIAQMQAHGWGQHDVYSVRLALEEAMVNAVLHGNQLNRRKRVHIGCRLGAELVQIEVGDEGSGFDPQALPDPTDAAHLECPCGRGVMLMKAFMSRVVFNAAGNHVLMEKVRDTSC